MLQLDLDAACLTQASRCDRRGIGAAFSAKATSEPLCGSALEHGDRLEALVGRHASWRRAAARDSRGRPTGRSCGWRSGRCGACARSDEQGALLRRAARPRSALPRPARACASAASPRLRPERAEPHAFEADGTLAVVGDARRSSSSRRRRSQKTSCRRRPRPGPTSRRSGATARSAPGRRETRACRNASCAGRPVEGAMGRALISMARWRGRRDGFVRGRLDPAQGKRAAERRGRHPTPPSTIDAAAPRCRHAVTASMRGLEARALNAHVRAGRRPWRVRARRALLEQLHQLVGHGAGELGRIGDGDGAAVVARHVVADADGDQLDRERVSISSITWRRCRSR